MNANTLSSSRKAFWLITTFRWKETLQTGTAGESGRACGPRACALLGVGLNRHSHGEREEERKDASETHRER